MVYLEHYEGGCELCDGKYISSTCEALSEAAVFSEIWVPVCIKYVLRHLLVHRQLDNTAAMRLLGCGAIYRQNLPNTA